MVILDFPKAVFGNTLSYYTVYIFYFILSVKHGIFVVLLFCSYYYILVNLYFNLSILYYSEIHNTLRSNRYCVYFTVVFLQLRRFIYRWRWEMHVWIHFCCIWGVQQAFGCIYFEKVFFDIWYMEIFLWKTLIL